MKRFFCLPILFVFALSLFFAPAPLSAKERITSFDVEAEIGQDASLTVKERITVIAEGSEIKRGIIRSIPTDFTDTEGVRRRAPLELLSAKLDGNTTLVEVTRSGSDLNFRLGDPDVFLDHGEHVFEIVYRTWGQLGFFADHDELYWNATGNEWTFEIEKAAFRARLPGKAFGEGFTNIEFYTGRTGEKGTAARVLPDGTVESTRTYFPGHGLTVVFSWPRGVIMPPEHPAPRAGGVIAAVLPFIQPVTTVLLLALMLVFWWLWGRDPEPRPVIPLFELPKDVEAGFARYVRNMRTDDGAFTAMILGMAVKGALSIEQTDMGDFASSLIGAEPSAAGKALKLLAKIAGPTFKLRLDRGKLGNAYLTATERRLAQDLFGSTRNEIILSTADRLVIFNAFSSLAKVFKARGKPFLATNLGKWLTGVALFEISAIGSFILMVISDHFTVEPFIALFAGPFFLLPLSVPVAPGRGAFITRLIFKILFPGVFVLISLVIGFFSIIGNMGIALWTLPFPFISVAVLLIFKNLLRVRTEQGARLNESIEGLRMYITAAEKHRLEMISPPEETPETFERLLPYAFALDAAETWANRFQSVLAAAGYSPSWYSGSLDTFTSGAGVAAFSSALSGAVSSGTRSSGSGGGGSSGGGGGGGGGSGW